MKRIIILYLATCMIMVLCVCGYAQDQAAMERLRIEREIESLRKQDTSGYGGRVSEGYVSDARDRRIKTLRQRLNQLEAETEQYFYEKQEREAADARRPASPPIVIVK